MSDLINILDQLIIYKSKNPSASKAAMEKFVNSNFKLEKKRAVYNGDGFAIRFSQVTGDKNGFSNTILGLSTLLKYDNHPFVVCIVRDDRLDFMLANTTFLKKISHSSLKLTDKNIKGSFLGQDIKTKYKNILNNKENISELFEIHSGFPTKRNIKRLVKATAAIKPTGKLFESNPLKEKNIMQSPALFISKMESADYKKLKKSLTKAIVALSSKILKVAREPNVNIRGNSIEQIITKGINEHKIEDIEKTLSDGTKVLIDVKTKRVDLSSSPKAFNIDKTLESLSTGNAIFFFMMVLIDIKRKKVECHFVPILSDVLVSKLAIQHHWAGRDSRGVTQISSGFYKLIQTEDYNVITEEHAQEFLKKLLNPK